jgi:hypothetical protein
MDSSDEFIEIVANSDDEHSDDSDDFEFENGLHESPGQTISDCRIQTFAVCAGVAKHVCTIQRAASY